MQPGAKQAELARPAPPPDRRAPLPPAANTGAAAPPAGAEAVTAGPRRGNGAAGDAGHPEARPGGGRVPEGASAWLSTQLGVVSMSLGASRSGRRCPHGRSSPYPCAHSLCAPPQPLSPQWLCRPCTCSKGRLCPADVVAWG